MTRDAAAFDEDLPRLAAANLAIADRLCGPACGPMHALWPYIRLARASTGAEAEESELLGVLARLLEGGGRHALVAGSQDTGLFALTARAGHDHAPHITVLDRCATPLESCRCLAASWSMPVSTVRRDLMDFDQVDRFDAILVHGTLHYVPAARRADVLMRLRRALRAGGKLVLLFNTGRRIEGGLAAEGRTGYAEWVIAELDRLGVAIPEARDTFAARLRAHAANREDREGAFSDAADVTGLLAAAGFHLDHCAEAGVSLAAPMREFVAKLGKRRFLAIAGR